MRKANLFVHFAILLVGLIGTNTVFADVKIKARQTMSGQSTENTTYIKGKRMRAEQNNGAGTEMVTLTQCDLKRYVRVMPQTQVYMVDAWQAAQNVAPTTTTEKTQAVTKGGVITTTISTKDTGERKQMFGYTAKHLITTMETSSSPDACSVNKSKMEIDGWYIDAAFVLNCESEQYAGNMQKLQKSGCQDRHDYKQVGKARTGYPVLEKTTMFDESGKETFSMLSEVTELSNATLDAALFDVPSGYREVKDASELYASMSSQSSTSNQSSMTLPNSTSKGAKNNYNINGASTSNNAGIASTVKNSSEPTPNAPAEVGAKKEGVVRIGLANVKTGAVGEGINAQELAGAIQYTLLEYVKTPTVEIVPLEAKLPSAINEEAESKECDYVIYATVAHKKGGGGFGMFKKIAPVLGNTLPLGGLGGSVAGQVAGRVTSSVIYTAATMAGNVKSKDEVTLDVKMQSVSGTPTFAKQYKGKAKSDGEDIISPMIEQAAQAIIDAAKI